MSKKTRKKSSKGSAKTPAKTPAKSPAKTPAKKSAHKTIPAKAARSGSKAPVKTPAAKAGKVVAKKSGTAAKGVLTKESHKPASKSLKSKPLTAPKPDLTSIPEAAAKPDSKPGLVSGRVEGAKAPSFRLPRDGGDSVSLADYAGRKLVLFFYPRADTPGCTREAIDFTRLKDAFAESGTAVLGISADTVKAQESFRDKHQLSIALISDEKHEMLEAYGAWGEKSMYGRTFLGILRTTVLIGKDGKIAKIWRNVRVDGHADEVLAAAQGL
ncbi:peroxiredoxin [Bradyrhizobium sp. JYMT SZCCT0428]|uniref:peroxiredoxin n=1 Tax=Bradyrhizobium sp. JYMT SZCCT0428 TaxID=2807673 RepID=UPI001BADCAAE|nr:peroxiredoxin [Bradyrhizobium sp. JYMT SZCCT0428]MBR1149158.1 redoxin domain-containing protein [Bradyrhizobium sp. JYMT SZCCT0428]